MAEQARAFSKTKNTKGSSAGMLASSDFSLSSLYGSFSSGGYGATKDDCEGISLALLLTTFASIGVVFFTVFTKLTMLGKRRRKRSALLAGGGEEEEAPNGEPNAFGALIDNLHTVLYEGEARETLVVASCTENLFSLIPSHHP